MFRWRRAIASAPQIAAPAIVPDPPSPFSVGERDIQLDGWRNDATGELFPGVPIAAGDVVADIGCSDHPGIARFCVHRGARMILLDTDTAGLARVRQQLSDVDPAMLSFVDGDENTIPLPDESVTTVVSTEVLEHVNDPVAFMNELALQL